MTEECFTCLCLMQVFVWCSISILIEPKSHSNLDYNCLLEKLEDKVKLLLHYKHTLKDHNKPLAYMPNQLELIRNKRHLFETIISDWVFPYVYIKEGSHIRGMQRALAKGCIYFNSFWDIFFHEFMFPRNKYYLVFLLKFWNVYLDIYKLGQCLHVMLTIILISYMVLHQFLFPCFDLDNPKKISWSSTQGFVKNERHSLEYGILGCNSHPLNNIMLYHPISILWQ